MNVDLLSRRTVVRGSGVAVAIMAGGCFGRTSGESSTECSFPNETSFETEAIRQVTVRSERLTADSGTDVGISVVLETDPGSVDLVEVRAADETVQVATAVTGAETTITWRHGFEQPTSVRYDLYARWNGETIDRAAIEATRSR